MDRKTCIANKANYGSARNLSSIKFIVVHYTANDGDSDENNGKYFQNNIVNASSHYFVDDNSVTQSVPDNHTAWAVGGTKWKNTKGSEFYGVCTNFNSISVELCDNVKNGVVYPTDQTITNALIVVKELMAKYNIPAEHVIRHFDVTGKLCPAYWVNDAKWESEFHSKLTGEPVKVTNPVAPSSQTVPHTTSVIDVMYQSFAKDKGWLKEVKNAGAETGDGYSGWYGYPIMGFRAKTLGSEAVAGRLEYRAHSKNGKWYGWRTDYTKDSAGDTFAGTCKTELDRLQMRIVGVDGHHVVYRVHTRENGWLAWITDFNDINSNGYAGVSGHAIDGVQVKIV